MNTKPNILWVSFEDCNPLFGCYGDPVARTPNLDRLAAEGGIWPKAFSTAPVCSPARSAVITGMYPVSIGTHHHRTDCGPNYPNRPYQYEAVIPHYVKCFPEYLRADGYYCTNNSKTDYQFKAPVTAWDECNGQAHWRNRPDPDQPFFAVFNLGATHESGMFKSETDELITDPDSVPVPPYFPDTPKVRRAIAKNYDNIAFNDGLLGEFLDQLAEDGLTENTAVFIWSDHGPMPRGKRWPQDTGIHSPMIIRWPGRIDPGTVSDRLVSTMDLGPTVLSMTDQIIPNHLQGQAFLGNQTAEPREYIHVSRDRYDAMYDMTRAVRDSRYKYIRNFQVENPRLLWNKYRNIHPIMQELWRCHAEGCLEEGPQADLFHTHRPAEELYDTEADPHEVTNIAGDPAHAGTLERLRDECDRWMRDVGDQGLIPEDDMFHRMWPGGVQPTTSAPQLITLGTHATGVEESRGETVEGPVLLQMQSPTQGASIAYAFEGETDRPWRLYTEPIRLPVGTTQVRAKAIRIGYRESEETAATFLVT
ncbi:MAG: sulfatase-like hydrolase/transferase [Planctomycetota bacterium]|jgi:arylsulfatase A-like enzyme